MADNSDVILILRVGDVTTIRFNRPQRYNSFNKEMAFDFQEKIEACRKDGTRCLVITGEGKAFSAGQDLNEVTDPNGPRCSELLLIITTRSSKHSDLELPVIAAVNGAAAGAGANIALACDIVVAKESSYFLQAFSHIGLIPDSGGTYHLPRLIGFQRASALMMLGEKVGAKDAETMGMIYKAIPDAEWDDYTRRRLAAMPTRGLAFTKRALK